MRNRPAVSRRTFTAAAAGIFFSPRLAFASTISREAGAVDIRTFGAAGDGLRNDTAAIAAALRTSQTIYVPAGIYLVDFVMLPSGRTILTDGYSTVFRQRPGTPNEMRLLNVVGSNINIGDCTLEGNITSDKGEQHHGIFINASKDFGDLTDIRIGNVRGLNLRGDVIYIGSTNVAAARRIQVGQILGSNILRNVVSVAGGSGLAIESIRGSHVGYAHLDIEPDAYNGPVIGCVIGSVHGTFVQIAGQTHEAYVDRVKIGMLVLGPPVQSSMPLYSPGSDRADALTLRNVRSVEIDRFIAKGCEGSAIRQIWNTGELTDQRVHILEANISDCCKNRQTSAYIRGSRRATRLAIDSLSVDVPHPGIDVVRDCKESHIHSVRGKLAKGSRLLAQSKTIPDRLRYTFWGAALGALVGLEARFRKSA